MERVRRSAGLKAKSPLGEVLVQIVAEVRRYFLEAQQRRAQEAIDAEKRRVEWEEQQRKYQAEEAIRREEERKRKHAEAIETVMKHRKEDLLKAAEWWRLHQVAEEFIAACEQRWREAQADQLNPEQEEWLQWARKTTKALSPFEMGYPEPEKDGSFAPLSVPTGGPYPETREFSQLPTMPETPGARRRSTRLRHGKPSTRAAALSVLAQISAQVVTGETRPSSYNTTAIE